MEHWQQMAYRVDPFGNIPFATEAGLSIDAKVGLVCVAAVILVSLFGG